MRCVRKIDGGPPAPAIAFTSKGALLLSTEVVGHGAGEFLVKLNDVATGLHKLLRHKSEGHSICIAVSGRDRFVGVVTDARKISILDLARESMGRVQHECCGEPPLVFHPTEDYCAFVVSAGVDGPSCDAVIVDYIGGKVLRRMSHGMTAVRGLAFSPDGRSLATGADDGLIRLWDTTSGELQKILGGHQHLITGIRFSPTGRMMATCGWGWNEGKSESEMIIRELGSAQAITGGACHSRLNALAFSHDGRILVTVGGMTRGELAVWETGTGKLLSWIVGERGKPFWAVACSPTEDLLAVSVHDGSIEIWEFGREAGGDGVRKGDTR